MDSGTNQSICSYLDKAAIAYAEVTKNKEKRKEEIKVKREEYIKQIAEANAKEEREQREAEKKRVEAMSPEMKAKLEEARKLLNMT